MQTGKRPRHSTDFDIKIGLHNLKIYEATDRLKTWKAPLWENGVCFVFSMIVILSGYLAVNSNPDLFESFDSTWDTVARFLATGVFMLGLWFLSARCLHRPHLELNGDEGCLLFYRRLLFPRPFYRLRLCDIATVGKFSASDRGSGDDSAAWAYKIIAAEMKSGELVSITFDSRPNILAKIRQAISQLSTN